MRIQIKKNIMLGMLPLLLGCSLTSSVFKGGDFYGSSIQSTINAGFLGYKIEEVFSNKNCEIDIKLYPAHLYTKILKLGWLEGDSYSNPNYYTPIEKDEQQELVFEITYACDNSDYFNGAFLMEIDDFLENEQYSVFPSKEGIDFEKEFIVKLPTSIFNVDIGSIGLGIVMKNPNSLKHATMAVAVLYFTKTNSRIRIIDWDDYHRLTGDKI